MPINTQCIHTKAGLLFKENTMALVQNAPRFSAVEAVDLARALYGVRGHAPPLPSERDQNFLISTATGEQFVLKIANALEDPALLDAQNQALAFVAGHSDRSLCPHWCRPSPGRPHHGAGADGRSHWVRLLSYLPGTPGHREAADARTGIWAMGNWTRGRLRPSCRAPPFSLGRGKCSLLGHVMGIDRVAGFDHPAVHRHFHWDVAHAAEIAPPGRN